MNPIKNIRSFILEDDFRLNVLKNKVNIVNYTDIGHFDRNKVQIKYKEGEIFVYGENLVVSKLLKDEILIEGNIQNIELK